MTKPLKIMYLGIAVWPSWEIAARKMWIWRRSIDRFGYRFFYYGVGTPQFLGYRQQKVEAPLEHLLTHGWGDCTHILYTDCCDCLMLAPQGEIERKYEDMGKPPMLVSGSRELGNVSDDRFKCFDSTEPPFQGHKLFRYPNVGGYLMEADLAVDMYRKMKPYSEGDDCFIWYRGFEEGWFRPEIDADCQIWQVRSHEEGYSEIVRKDGTLRFRNKITGTYPAIWHCSGGYSDPEFVKDEAMRPWAETFEIIRHGDQRP